MTSHHARLLSAALLTTSAIATAVLVYRADRPWVLTLPLIVLSIGCLVVIALVPALRDEVQIRVVGLLMLVVLAAALVTAPPDGADMWVYHQAGRTLAEHGDSPYLHAPSDYPDDPFVQRITLYRESLSPFGPGYLAFTATVAEVARDSRLAVRLAYQVGAAAAVGACFFLMRRARAPSWCIALLVLNPVLIVEVVGQGRSDAYPALALLAAALAARRRPYLAALAIAVAASIKLPMLLALAALCLWIWRRSGLARAVGVGATGAVPLLVAYAAVGGTVALRPLTDLRDIANGASVWVLARENGIASVLGDLGAQLGPVGAIPTFAAMAGLALAVVLLIPRLSDRQADAVLATPLLAYLLTSTYPTARYLMWVLPVFLLRPRALQATITIALSTAILAMNQYLAALFEMRDQNPLVDGVIVDDRLFRMLHALPVLIDAGAIVALVLAAAREIRHGPEPAKGASAYSAGAATS